MAAASKTSKYQHERRKRRKWQQHHARERKANIARRSENGVAAAA